MTALSIASLLGGSALSVLGGAMSGRSQQRAGRQARDMDILRGMRQRLALTRDLYGGEDLAGTLAQVDPGYWERLLRDTYGLGDQALGYDIDAGNLPQLMERLRQLGVNVGAAPAPGQEGSLIGEQRARGAKAARRGAELVADFDLATGGLTLLDNLYGDRVDELAAGAELFAEQFGRDADRVLEDETRRALRSANARATSALMARGLGSSTLVGNQLAQNEILAGERLAAGKVGVRQAVADRKIAARGARAGLRAQTGGQARSLAHQRALQRNALANLALDRELSWEDVPTRTRLAMATSPLMNPGAGTSSGGYYTGGAGAGGAALADFGSGIAGLGSMALMAELYPQLFRGGGGGQ